MLLVHFSDAVPYLVNMIKTALSFHIHTSCEEEFLEHTNSFLLVVIPFEYSSKIERLACDTFCPLLYVCIVSKRFKVSSLHPRMHFKALLERLIFMHLATLHEALKYPLHQFVHIDIV